MRMSRRMGLYIPTVAGVPEFTYSGTYDVEVDESGNWKIYFLDTGTLTFSKLGSAKDGIDVFVVGGAAGGGPSTTKINEYVTTKGAGGAGGRTSTANNVSVTKGTPYIITVGAGGGIGTDGGVSSAFGNSVTAATAGGIWNGGNGGSGGGAGINNNKTDITAGGTDGWNGADNPLDANNYKGGTGQGTTTREFAEMNGVLYSAGGNGGEAGVKNGSANTGDGGNRASKGGSGIVIIRNHRNPPLRTYLFEAGEGQKVAFSTGKGTNGSVSVSTSKVSISRNLNYESGHEVYWLTTQNQSLEGKTSLVFRAKCTDILNQSDNEWNGRFLVLSSRLTSLTAPSLLGITEYVSVIPIANSTTKEYVIDVSKLNGSYSIGWWGCGTVEIYDVYMV